MRKYITTELGVKGFRCEESKRKPNIDLAMINDTEKAVLLLELKWFISPAAPRERTEKSKEISKGVSQVKKLRTEFSEKKERLLSKLKVDSSYTLEGVVVSHNWIGYADVQSPEVPVIQLHHLIAKLKGENSLKSTIEWLKNREYLPKLEEDFTVDETSIRVGDWILKSPRIVRDNSEPFFPL